jgi:hypothetical protein
MRMLKVGIAVIGLSVALAGHCHAGPDEPSDVIAELPESIKAEMRWVRAERDKANAFLARDFAGERERGKGDEPHEGGSEHPNGLRAP